MTSYYAWFVQSYLQTVDKKNFHTIIITLSSYFPRISS